MKMENLKDFFDCINKECLFYSIDVNTDGKVSIKWETLTYGAYTLSPQTVNRINLRIHKVKKKKTDTYFLDFFQSCPQNSFYQWRGFHINFCTHYEIRTDDLNHEPFDVIFRFDEKEHITISHINTEIFLILQDFFFGFM